MCYIYKATKDNEVLYIGKTVNMKSRMYQHKKDSKWWDEADKLEYFESPNKTVMSIYERYYINKLKPIYNIQMNKGDDVSSLKVREMKFLEYIFLHKPVVDKKREDRESNFKKLCELFANTVVEDILNDKVYVYDQNNRHIMGSGNFRLFTQKDIAIIQDGFMVSNCGAINRMGYRINLDGMVNGYDMDKMDIIANIFIMRIYENIGSSIYSYISNKKELTSF